MFVCCNLEYLYGFRPDEKTPQFWLKPISASIPLDDSSRSPCRPMWAVSRVFARPAARATSRCFATKEQVTITDVRKGMILRYDERYCQVKEWYAHKQGRGAAAYHVTYDELDTGKQRVQKFGSGTKLVKVEPDKQECQVTFRKKQTLFKRKDVCCNRSSVISHHTVDGRNPANHLERIKPCKKY